MISLWKFYRGVKLWSVHRPEIVMQTGLAGISMSIRGLSKLVQIRRPWDFGWIFEWKQLESSRYETFLLLRICMQPLFVASFALNKRNSQLLRKWSQIQEVWIWLRRECPDMRIPSKLFIWEVATGSPGSWAGGKAASTGSGYMQTTTVAATASFHWGPLGTMWNTCASGYPTWGLRELGYLSANSCQSLAEGYSKRVSNPQDSDLLCHARRGGSRARERH